MTRIANQLTVFYEKNIVFTQVILKFKGQILPCDFQNTNHFLILHVSKTRHDNLSYLYHNIFYQIHPSKCDTSTDPILFVLVSTQSKTKLFSKDFYTHEILILLTHTKKIQNVYRILQSRDQSKI